MADPELVYCPHMDTTIYTGSCTICTPRQPERVIGHVAVTMTAQFETGCEACENRIKPGEEIALVDGEWIHLEHTEVNDG